MKLFMLSQDVYTGYDTYDSAVVAAEDENAAKLITPDGRPFEKQWGAWCDSPLDVGVEYIGEAKEGTEQGVILASFNAG